MGKVWRMVSDQIKQSLRLQLIITFAFCLGTAIVVAAIAGSLFFESRNTSAEIDYTVSIGEIDERTRRIANQISNNSTMLQHKEEFQSFLNSSEDPYNMQVLIVGIDGKVLYKSQKATETQVDLHSIIRNAMDVRLSSEVYRRGKEFISFYPLTLNEETTYIITRSIPEPRIVYYNTGEGSGLAVLTGFAAFMFLFYLLTKRKMKYIEYLTQGLQEISKGDLGYRVVKKGVDELGVLADNINFMAEELNTKIERERQAEKLKNELITNISHDLRTPLTSIMGYLKLISDKKYESEAELEEYAQVSFGKSEKLKVLIEDLFEYTKLSNEGVRLNKSSINLNELVEQLMEELVPVCEENEVVFKNKIPREKIMVQLDAEKMVRVFENIFTNAIKYSYKPGEITVEMKEEEERVLVSIRNRGDNIHGEELEKLFHRFYRREKSRSSTTGGSGLGLAISRSIVELHGGNIWAECKENDIKFCISLNK